MDGDDKPSSDACVFGACITGGSTGGKDVDTNRRGLNDVFV